MTRTLTGLRLVRKVFNNSRILGLRYGISGLGPDLFSDCKGRTEPQYVVFKRGATLLRDGHRRKLLTHFIVRGKNWDGIG